MLLDVKTNQLLEVMMMGRIKAHGFIALDGVAQNPRWSVQEHDVADVRPVFGKEAE